MITLRWPILGCMLAVAGCGETDPQSTVAAKSAVAACEEVTRDQAISPPSFKTLWSDYTEREPLNQDDIRDMYKAGRCSPVGEKECLLDSDRFMDASTERKRKELSAALAAGKKLNRDDQRMAETLGLVEWPQDHSPSGKTGFVLLEYQSENAFGASLRAFGICRLGAIGDDGKFEKSNVIKSGPIPLDEGIRTKAQYEDLKGRR